MSKRRTGVTTRGADEIIQLLFKGRSIVIGDAQSLEIPHDVIRLLEENTHADRHLYDVVMNRLKLEHGHLFDNKRIITNKQKLTIQLNLNNNNE